MFAVAVAVAVAVAAGYFRRGEALMELKEYARAEIAFQTALELAPKDDKLKKLLWQAKARGKNAMSGARKVVAATCRFLVLLLPSYTAVILQHLGSTSRPALHTMLYF